MPADPSPTKLSEIQRVATALSPTAVLIGNELDGATERTARFPMELLLDALDTKADVADLGTKADATHSHAQSDVTGLTAALAAKAEAEHSHAQSDVTGLTAALGTKADATHSHAQSDVTGLTAALAAKADLVGGVIPTAQIPALAIATFLTPAPASQSAMLDLRGQPGDWTFRTDVGAGYWIVANDGSSLSDWQAVSTPGTSSVVSVNGQTGIIVLGKTDIGLGNVPNVDTTNRSNHTGSQAISTITGLQTELNSKEPTQTAASQAEVELGSQSAIRKFSPLRIAQAIDARRPALVRGSGILMENNVPATGSTSPPNVELIVTSYTDDCVIEISANDNPVLFTISLSDPSDGSVWVDRGYAANETDLAMFIETAINGSMSGYGISASPSGAVVTVSNSSSGASTSLYANLVSGSGVSPSGGGSGTDSSPASGGVILLTLIESVSAKSVRPIRVGYAVSSTFASSIEFFLDNGSDHLLTLPLNMGASPKPDVDASIDPSMMTAWMEGISSAALKARIVNPGDFVNGAECTAWAIAELT